jgi:hypothetical protein
MLRGECQNAMHVRWAGTTASLVALGYGTDAAEHRLAYLSVGTSCWLKASLRLPVAVIGRV